MIARLRGRLDSLGEDHAVVDVGGVGYLVACSARTLAGLPGTGEAVDLHVETQLRAESITLYGFRDPAERAWFRLLQTVQGVGARVALGVLSVLTPDQLARAVAAQDKAALTRASGVGPRLASRIVAELKDRLVDFPLPAVRSSCRRPDRRRRRCRRALRPDQPRLRPQRSPRRGRQGRRRFGRPGSRRRPDPHRPQGADRRLSHGATGTGLSAWSRVLSLSKRRLAVMRAQARRTAWIPTMPRTLRWVDQAASMQDASPSDLISVWLPLGWLYDMVYCDPASRVLERISVGIRL